MWKDVVEPDRPQMTVWRIGHPTVDQPDAAITDSPSRSTNKIAIPNYLLVKTGI